MFDQRVWYANNRERILERRNAIRAADPERNKNNHRLYLKYRDRALARKKLLRTEQPEKMLAIKRAWAVANREKINRHRRESYWRNPKKARLATAMYRKMHRLECLNGNANWIKNNKEHVREYQRSYYHKRKEADKEYLNSAAKAWRSINHHKLKGITRRHYLKCKIKIISTATIRNRKRKEAMPPWVDRSAIEAFYAEAQKRTKETGIKHHVDHRMPLVHKRFSGLHVPWNLQVLTATENISKGNRVAHCQDVDLLLHSPIGKHGQASPRDP